MSASEAEDSTPCDPIRTQPMTLHRALDVVTAQAPDQLISFPDEKETLRYAELAATSTTTAAALRSHGVRPGDRVGVLAPNAPEFLTALFAALRCGAAAAPLALPVGTDLADYAARLAKVIDTAGMSHIVVSHRIADRIAPVLTALGGPTVLDSATLLDGSGPDPIDPAPAEDVPVSAAAIVQFTSGSTAAPKGVVLSHANVWHCARSITEAIALTSEDVHGSWLPLFHDMGLFGALTGLFRGIPLHLWSPAGFVRRPARWLGEFAAVRATISTMPNFGYDSLLAAVSPEQAAELDLSAWRVAFNGAEAVSAEATTAFLDRFAAAGFRPSTMVPAYGMAEVTLVATLPPQGRAPVLDHVDRDALTTGTARPGTTRTLVGLGRAVPGMEVRIADDERVAPDRTVGEIQMRGAMATSGYLGLEREVLFTADGWLRSGDLGYLVDGELFFTGRLKEMITVAGRNIYPLDVEDAARAVEGVHKGRCVAFAEVTGDAERVVLVAETTATDHPDLARRLRERVAAVADVPGVTVHLVSPRTIPRTTSGKLRRLDMAARLSTKDWVTK